MISSLERVSTSVIPATTGPANQALCGVLYCVLRNVVCHIVSYVMLCYIVCYVVCSAQFGIVMMWFSLSS